MPAFIDWSSLFQWQPATPPAPPPPLQQPPLHEPPSAAVDDRPAGFGTLDSCILIATVAAVVLGAVWTWLLARKLSHKGQPVGPPETDAQVAARLQNHDRAIDSLRGELSQMALDSDERTKEILDQLTAKLEARTTQALGRQAEDTDERMRKAINDRFDAIESKFQEVLEQRMKAIEVRTQQNFDSGTAAIEATTTRRLGQRVEDVEDTLRAKLNKESFDAIYHSISRRVEMLEDGVRVIDGRQLDQEACGVVQRALGQRLDVVEETTGVLDGRSRASVQRLDAVDDSIRVVDSRGKAMSQRLEAVEDNMGSVDGQATLLAHDMERGQASLDRLAKQIQTLPDHDRLRTLTDDWEERFRELEAHVSELEDERTKLLEAPAPELSWSPMVAQEIEPAGPLYTTTTPHDNRRHGFGYTPDMMPPTPSPSDRSHSRSSRTSSFFGRESLLPTPTRSFSKRKKLDEAGFKEPTFASQQRLYHSRSGSHLA